MAPAASQLILGWMSEHDRELVELLERLAGAESPSLDPESQRGPFDILAAELDRIDYLVRPVRGVRVGDHLYARPRQRLRGGPRQLLIGHMDTVWPVGTIAEMPLHEEGGLLFGPGVADMKGGLVEIVFALRALHELELRPSVTPVVFVNTDEEIGSVDSTRFIRLLAQGAERAFVLESGEGADGKLKIARKGLGRFTVTVHGRSSHAGADFEHGISAILELSHQVQRLFALNDPAQGVTVNVGTIDGGLRPNVVAPAASAIVDVRAPTAAAAHRLERAVRGLRPVLEGATIEVEGGFGRPPMEPLPRNRALLATAKRLGHELGLSLEDAGLVGGGSDANTTSLFTGTLDGLGPIGEGSHASDERVDTSPAARAVGAPGAASARAGQSAAAGRPSVTQSTHARLTAPAATRVAVRGTEASDTNVEIVAAWRALGIDAALVGPNGDRWVAASRVTSCSAGSTSFRPSTVSSPASSSFSGSSGAVSVSSTRPRPSPPLTTSCSLPVCSPGRGSLIRAPSISGPTVTFRTSNHRWSSSHATAAGASTSSGATRRKSSTTVWRRSASSPGSSGTERSSRS